ncbi:transglutaminaseTgpA domain-containing protein [Streptacidiphilus sp. EB129]|uniref:transglutaminase family protein n=1 Tax=Streptacidiphilus sp. EB129 TaxID=3156262 RepID=UPI0035141E49
MNGRTRIAVHAASATLLTALCLWPLVSSAAWLIQAAFLVLVSMGVGLSLHRLPVPRPLVPVLQLLVLVLLLTLIFANSTALWGVLPDPGSVRQLNGMLRQGFTDMSQYGAPAPLSDGLRLILVGSVALVGLVVDTLATTYQRVALTGLPLLGLFSVGTGLHLHGALWFWFLLAAFGYLSLLLAEGQDRLSRWGRIFQGTPATMAAAPSSNPLSSTGYRIAGLAVLAGLLLPMVLPSLNTPLVGRFGSGGDGGNGGSGIITAVNPLASLAQSLQQPVNQNVLSYTTNAPNLADQYLRIVDLDSFNGVSWTTSSQQVVNVPQQLPAVSGLDLVTPAMAVTTKVNTSPDYAQQWLPMPYPATSVRVSGNWKYEPDGRTLVGADSSQNAGGLQYTVDSLAVRPTTDQLRAAAAPPASIQHTYLALPKNFPTVVSDLAQAVTRTAITPYDKAVALQNFFTTTGGFTYSTTVAPGTGTDAIVQFLRNRKGFCVHYAATMAAMARSLGIPARVSIGFTPGTQQADGSWLVGTKNAHAWPELYFSGVGWLRFEPTPTIGVAPDYSTPSSAGGGASSQPSDGASAGTAPQSTPHANQSCSVVERKAGGCHDEQPLTPATTGTGTSWPDPLVPALTAAAVLVLLGLLTPMLWRLRARRARLRRRGADGSGESAGTELSDRQVLDAWRELIDSAWDLGIPPDEAETPRGTAARLSELGALEEAPRAAAGRLALATEQVLYAPRVSAMPALRQDVRTVRSGLQASATRGTRVRALLFPPSAARPFRAARARISGAGQRLLPPWRRD